MSANRMSKEFEDGVKEFVKVAVAHAEDTSKIICPCLKCCYGPEELAQTLPDEDVEDRGRNDILYQALDRPQYSGRVRARGFAVCPKDVFPPELPAAKQKTVDNIHAMYNRVIERLNILEREKEERHQASEAEAVEREQPVVKCQQPEAVEREQPSVKDSCNPVDFDTIPKGISSIKIYVASPSRKLVARGKLHTTKGDMVHGMKLPLGYVKVTIEVVHVADALLPIPVEDGDVSTIGQAVGTIVAWPFHLVEFVGECRKINNKLQNKDKKMQRSAESVASPTKPRKKFKNQEPPAEVGDSKNLGFLRTFVTHMWAAESLLEVSMGEKAFGEEFVENLHAEHLNEVLNHEWLSATVINVYARYLYDKFISSSGLTSKLYFLSPHESHDDVDGKKSIKRILLTNKKVKDKIILAPFNFGKVHWALLVIDPDAGIIYYLDPMATDPTRHLICKKRFENALLIYRAYNLTKPVAKSNLNRITWIRIECPQQTNTTDCGYFVMRFMKEIVMQYPKKIPDKYFDEYKCRTYSKDKLDEVKDEWAEYMLTNVIPGGSWIKYV
ncbi:ubiquitin-specific protease [Trifolium repens]|nr:ubiquitin-specific protease [Trifolium repens]